MTELKLAVLVTVWTVYQLMKPVVTIIAVSAVIGAGL